jgi:hypothetical protein
MENPHRETVELAEQGMEEWSRGLPEEVAGAPVDSRAGTDIRCAPGEGWVENRA